MTAAPLRGFLVSFKLEQILASEQCRFCQSLVMDDGRLRPLVRISSSCLLHWRKDIRSVKSPIPLILRGSIPEQVEEENPRGRTSCPVTPHHTQPFKALFPGPPGLAGARRELLDFMVQGKINRGRHTDHPAGRHSIRTNQCPPPPSPTFYRPDAVPAAQPMVSKHWRQLAHSD